MLLQVPAGVQDTVHQAVAAAAQCNSPLPKFRTAILPFY